MRLRRQWKALSTNNMSPYDTIRLRNYDLLPSGAIMPRFPRSANGFSKGSLAHAQAASHKEKAGPVWLIRACHEAIRARLESVFEFAKE